MGLARPTACGGVLTVSAERPCPPPRLKLSVRWWAGSQRSSASDTVSSIDRQTLLHLPKLVGSWLRLSQTKQAQIVTLSAWKILTLVFDCPPGFLVVDLYTVSRYLRSSEYLSLYLFILHL